MGSLRVRHDWVTSLSLSCIGEGNGNPLQRSCLKNPRDGGAWWAAAYRVAQSRTRLTRLSSSSSRGKETSLTTHVQKGLRGQKGSGCRSIIGDVNLLIGLCAGIYLGWEMYSHRGGPWVKPNVDSETGKVRWLVRENPEELPHISDLNYHEGGTLSEPACVYLSTMLYSF